MERKVIERGKHRGHLDVRGSMATMAPGEEWRIDPSEVAMNTVRNYCSRAGKEGGRAYTCRCPGETENFITIIRTR